MTNHYPSRTFLKYFVVQIPGWLLLIAIMLFLHSWVELSAWTAALVVGLAVVKDLLLYPFLRRAYEGDARTGAERLVGARGVAATTLAPHGYIRIRGELWRAESAPPNTPVPEGSAVKVTSGRGLTLVVSRD